MIATVARVINAKERFGMIINYMIGTHAPGVAKPRVPAKFLNPACKSKGMEVPR